MKSIVNFFGSNVVWHSGPELFFRDEYFSIWLRWEENSGWSLLRRKDQFWFHIEDRLRNILGVLLWDMKRKGLFCLSRIPIPTQFQIMNMNSDLFDFKRPLAKVTLGTDGHPWVTLKRKWNDCTTSWWKDYKEWQFVMEIMCSAQS